MTGLRLRATIRSNRFSLELEPTYSIRAHGFVRVGDVKVVFTLEGRLLVVDFRGPEGLMKEFIARPRSVIERFKELDLISRELSRAGLRVEVRVRGVKVHAYP